ncbi:hypothetical protein [Portibacter lacus]|uniref:O-antigen ligase domain-containing protein n=1 Tax=Portibacter lacus TaxID=1099794 RepID=A0AA37SRT6_9BACT|nr:hypothetical protein [Portibacter lacus]GLR18862.1 hypothetical protein GCM10007940_34780 [Portibacter lacus]
MFCTFFGMLLWVWNLNTIRLGLITIGLFLYLFAGLWAIFYEQKVKQITFLGKAAVLFYITFYFYCLFINLFADGIHEKYFPNLLWDSGFFFLGIGCLSFIGLQKKDLKFLVGFYVVFFIIDLIITGRYLDPTIAFTATDRRDAFRQISGALGHAHKAYQLHVILSSLALLMFALTLEYIKEKKWIIFSSLSVVALVFLGLFYQKRNVFIEVAIFSFFLIILPSLKFTKSGRNFKIIGILVFASLVALYLNQDIFRSGVNLVLDRFSNSGNYQRQGNYSSYERFAETQFYLDQYQSYYYLIGRGLTSFVPGAEGGNNLHLGVGNLLLKGGVPMVLSVLGLLVLNILYSIRMFFLKGIKIGLWIQSFCLLSLCTYLALWGWFPNIIYLPISLFFYDIHKSFKFKTSHA